MPADLEPMTVARRAPGDYAPAAGAHAVERLHARAEESNNEGGGACRCFHAVRAHGAGWAA